MERIWLIKNTENGKIYTTQKGVKSYSARTWAELKRQELGDNWEVVAYVEEK